MTTLIQIPHGQLAAFCSKHRIRRLALFGSALTGDLGPDSDIDLLVEFEPNARVGLFAISAMELELTEFLKRKVDLRTAEDLSRYFRDQVTASARVLYDAA